jgi:hypothetical protein
MLAPSLNTQILRRRKKMLKKICPTGSMVLTAAVLGFMLMFPLMVTAAEPKAGDVIDAGNVDQYKDYFPMFMQGYIKGDWDFAEPISINVKEAEFIGFTKGYLEASKKNMETCKLNADGLLEGYNGQGCPFLEPKEPNIGTKIMWNQFYKNFPDDWIIPISYITVTKRKGGRVTISDTTYEQILMSNRTQLEPIPEMTNNPNQLYYANKGNSLTPPNKDMASLVWRYKDPMKYDDMWMYVPTLRRTIRLISSERSNPIRGTPYTYDDIFGFDGKIPFFTYEMMGEQTILVLMSQKANPETMDRKNYPFHPVLNHNEEFETVDTYVIDIKAKDPRYPYSRKTVWVDKNKFSVLYFQAYDKNGKFWKGFWNGAQVRPLKTTYGEEPYRIQSASGITDFKTGYWIETITGGLSMNHGVEPEYFRPETLSGGTW